MEVRPRSIAIIGMGPSNAAYVQDGSKKKEPLQVDEVWVINSACRVFKADKIFVMDDLKHMDYKYPSYGAHLRTVKVPIITCRHYDDWPTSVEYPLKEVTECIRDDPFSNTVAYCIGLGIYYKVSDAEKAVLEVENFWVAVSQLAQTTMRNVVGELELDELLANREAAAKKIKHIVDSATDPWGIKVENVELKDITLPEEMKRTMAKQAEAERERRAVIIKSEGEVSASQNLADAAHTLSSQAGALHLRTLNTLNDLSSDQSNTVIFAMPLEVLRAFEKFNQK